MDLVVKSDFALGKYLDELILRCKRLEKISVTLVTCPFVALSNSAADKIGNVLMQSPKLKSFELVYIYFSFYMLLIICF